MTIWPPKPEVLTVPDNDAYCRHFNEKAWLSIMANSKNLSLGHCCNDWQPEMAVETGNTYISETTTCRIEISNGNSWVYDNVQLTESIDMQFVQRPTTGNRDIVAKPEIFMSMAFQRQMWNYWQSRGRWKCWQVMRQQCGQPEMDRLAPKLSWFHYWLSQLPGHSIPPWSKSPELGWNFVDSVRHSNWDTYIDGSLVCAVKRLRWSRLLAVVLYIHHVNRVNFNFIF